MRRHICTEHQSVQTFSDKPRAARAICRAFAQVDNSPAAARSSSEVRVFTSMKQSVVPSYATKSISAFTITSRVFRPIGKLKFAATIR